MKLELDLAWRMGPGTTKPAPPVLFNLLRGIADFGSLSAAAKQSGVSYRSAWNLIHQWSDYLGTPLVEATRGQGAHLTPLGHKLVWGVEHARQAMHEAGSATLADFQKEIDRVLKLGNLNYLTVHASHCLSHDVLRQHYFDETGAKLNLQHVGSGTCLEHLQAGACNVAGFHLADGYLHNIFCSRYLQFFNPHAVRLITALKRRQGLIVEPGNPLGLTGVADLAETGATIINRQLDSGTRLLFDELLTQSGIQSAEINGYDDVEFTHSAVGALVAEKSADAGLGTEAAALKFNLDFVPIVTETYYYAVPVSSWESQEVQALRRILSGSRWKQSIALIKGYDLSEAGKIEEGTDVLTGEN
jgi:putative molybdopterin biosynthesis protein